MTTNTMTTEQVKCMIAGKGTKITTVSFIKLDGTIRVINGLLRSRIEKLFQVGLTQTESSPSQKTQPNPPLSREYANE